MSFYVRLRRHRELSNYFPNPVVIGTNTFMSGDAILQETFVLLVRRFLLHRLLIEETSELQFGFADKRKQCFRQL
ncbi:hypothetical protein PVAP13_3KG484002 [Panicum virgatum]|uniref:Uncharacterized protein n=1 Tax=Panicum virgatum TaxID=38727 RepID=A0A8T0V7M3_PANVG|nr:hypothetical protein PVAP13_3KG484002 [Panicum virgatum]